MHPLLAIALAVVLGTAPHGKPGVAFHGHAGPVDARTRARMSGVSMHPGCPVGFDGLRLLTVEHWGFDGGVHRGRLIVARAEAGKMLAAMRSLFERRFPIRRVRLVDAYGGDDHRSMAADNTSAFNCRTVAGTTRWSEHAYGRAIDLNPVENPYVTAEGQVSPPAGAPYADRRRHRRGMVGAGAVRAFAASGWGWGGRWHWPKDFQHFSASGH